MIRILKKITTAAVLAASMAGAAAAAPAPQQTAPMTAVESLDLARYAGQWHEIAALPYYFQRQCAHSTTATYTLRDDGYLTVDNRCAGTNKGRLTESHGVARRAESEHGGRLEISFAKILGIQFGWGDYWIIGLAPDYRYAIIGTPSRNFGWILSRTPKLNPEDLEAAFEILRQQGYDPAKFVMTPQSGDGE